MGGGESVNHFQHHVVPIAARVCNYRAIMGAEEIRDDRAVGEAVEGADDGVRALVVDDGERIADGWRVSAAKDEIGAGEVDVATDA